MFLVLERHKRDIIYKDDYCIFIYDVKQIPKFIEKLLKRNKIKLKSPLDLDLSFLEKEFEGVHRARKRRRIR
jgi:hypothetical protein